MMLPSSLSVNIVSGDEVYSLVYCVQQEQPSAAGETRECEFVPDFVFLGARRIISDCVWQHGSWHCCFYPWSWIWVLLCLSEDWPVVWKLPWVGPSEDANLYISFPVWWQLWKWYQLCVPYSTPKQLPSCGYSPIPCLMHTEILRGIDARGASLVLSGKESTCQCRSCRFTPWVRKIPWIRKWQSTPVFLPGKSNAQRSLVGSSP